MANVTDDTVWEELLRATIGAGIVLGIVFVPIIAYVVVYVCIYNLKHPQRRRDCFQTILNTVCCCMHIQIPASQEFIDIPAMEDGEFGLGEFAPQLDDVESAESLSGENSDGPPSPVTYSEVPTAVDKTLHRD